jgi:hypothetical protein
MASAQSNIHQLRPKLRLVSSNATPAKIARRTVATLQIASGSGGAILCSNVPSVD